MTIQVVIQQILDRVALQPTRIATRSSSTAQRTVGAPLFNAVLSNVVFVATAEIDDHFRCRILAINNISFPFIKLDITFSLFTITNDEYRARTDLPQTFTQTIGLLLLQRAKFGKHGVTCS